MKIPSLPSLIVFAIVPIFHSAAADRFWDGGTTDIATNGDGASTYNTGNWNTTVVNWDQGSGLAHVAWNNASLDNAVFGGTISGSKTVTVNGGVEVNQIRFIGGNTSGAYTLGSTSDAINTIKFSGSYNEAANPGIDGSGSSNSTIAQKITGAITGGLIIKHGSNITTPGSTGRLNLTNQTNDFTGDVTVLSGNFAAGSGCGVASNRIILKGGSLFVSGGGAGTTTNTRAVEVASASGISTSAVTSGLQTLDLTGAITGSSNLTRYSSTSGSATSEVRFSGDMSGYTGTYESTGTAATLTTVQTTAASAGKWQITAGTITFTTAASLYGGSVGSWTKENIAANSGATLALNAGGIGEFSESQVATLIANLTTNINNNGLRAGATLRVNIGTGNAIGLANLANSTGTGSGAFGLGKTGAGTLTLSGGNTYTGQTVVQGGSFVFDGGSLDASATAPASRSFNVGSGGSAEIKNNAQITFGGWVGLGYFDNTGTGTLTLTSGSLTVNGISGGTPSDRGLVIGEYAGDAGTFNMNSGTLAVGNAAVYIGQNSAAAWNMAGGTASVKKIALGYNSASAGTLNLTGGTLSVGSGGISKGSGTATLNMGGGTLSSSASWSSSLPMNLTGTNGNLSASTAHTITLSGILSGTGGLGKAGTGTLILSGANTYSGNTDVSGGTLLANNTTGLATGTGTTVVHSTTILGGTGTIGAVTLESGSTLAPGNGAIGVLTTGALTLPAGAVLASEIDTSGPVGSDLISVNGDVTLGGTLGLSDRAVTAGAVPVGTKLTLIAYTGTLTGTFNGLAENAPVAIGINNFIIRYHDGQAVTLESTGASSYYIAWANSKGLDGTSNGPVQDPDHDGHNNLHEFAFDGDPLSGANDGRIVTKVAAVGGLNALTLTMPVRTGASFPDLGPDELVSTAQDGVTYHIQGSVDVTNWTGNFIDVNEVTNPADVAAVQGTLAADKPLPGGWTYRSFYIPGSDPAANVKIFIRAKVTE
ncbi:autotransporter-associated beta strand repeat-containing protein [Luteolibacter ambystomatis]|uniref:Autotransporter-associated beta strand repeat-containing protein n=1 Tax=Luteolibacter ambystomatis TaxID=2824561 RepID=A0A975G556_9BACT|nr:autotransporter-associated beta strand repeat-containing protein [Luteolibacter ambystomatis]QUE49519.1 autotransporter-associated beta strand repeat-containing protein [Luteolibacter ambystomatis]